MALTRPRVRLLMDQMVKAGESWQHKDEYSVFAWMRCLQLHIEPDKMRFQFFGRLPDGATALNGENAHLFDFKHPRRAHDRRTQRCPP